MLLLPLLPAFARLPTTPTASSPPLLVPPPFLVSKKMPSAFMREVL